MKFGPVPLDEAEGAILAHAVKRGGLVFKKGRVLSAADVAALAEAGVERVVAARLEPGDIGEDAAAYAIAERLAGAGVRVDKPFTGRANLFAEADGVLMLEAPAIHALNGVDEAITVATLPAFKPVVAGEMLATVKIIPFSVPSTILERASEVIAAGALRVAAYRPKSVAVISTLLPGLKPTVVDRTVATMGERLAPARGRVIADIRVPHETAALAKALGAAAGQANDAIVVFGASAITDRQDVIPAALLAAGGSIEHFGMPVDPGNLLLVGSLGGRPVLGAPGCARSPRENGFDWVLQRILADVPVRKADIQAMGVGGLLMEIVSRPQPRGDAGKGRGAGASRIALIVLAAGRSTRMGADNKLLALHDGKPLLRHAVEAALAADVGEVIVVTGHQAEAVVGALEGLAVRSVHNPDYAEGLSTSLRAGLAAAGDVEAAIIALGDMPLVGPGVIRRLVGAFGEHPEAKAVVPNTFGERGNPVLIGKALFADIAALTGDTGARKLIEAAGADVIDLAVDDPGIHRDIDTPEALAALRTPPAG